MMNVYPEGAARPTMQLPILTRTLSADVAGDFSLPDYHPEIKRLLRIEAGVLPPQRFASASGVELGGTLDYYVLYMGHDNRLYCAPLSTEYHLEAAPDGEARELMAAAGEPMVCLCDAVAEPPVGRVTAPRRLSIRCRLQATVKLYGECPAGGGGATVGDDGNRQPNGDIFATPTAEQDTEILRGRAEVARLWSGLGEALPLQDDIILPPGEQDDRRVVCAEGRVLMQEATVTDSGVLCRGEAVVKLTMCPDEAMAELMGEGGAADDAPLPTVDSRPRLSVLQRKIPFSAMVDMDIPGAGAAAPCAATARGFCTDLSVSVEDGHLHIDLSVVCEARAMRAETVSYVKDLYSTRRETACRYATMAAERPGRILCGNVTLSDSLPLGEVGLDPQAQIVDATATAYPEAITADADKGRCVLTGTCRAHLLLLRDGEYAAADMTLPFRYEFDDPALSPNTAPTATAGAAPDTTAFDGSVTVVTCRARMDGERVGLDAELAVSVRTMRPAPLTVLADATYGDEVTRRRGEYVVCFPAADDTLWSVAKRYHAPVAALAAANGLTTGEEERPEGVGYLIV